MSGRRRTIFFLVMLLAVLVLLTGQVRGEDRRSLGPLGTGVLTALAPLQTVMARVADSLPGARAPVGRAPASGFAPSVGDGGGVPHQLGTRRAGGRKRPLPGDRREPPFTARVLL